MGTKCSCLRPSNSEDNQISTEKDELTTNHRSTPLLSLPELIILQGLLRGYLIRKRFIPSNSFKFGRTFKNPAKIEEVIIPSDFANALTLETERKLGPYIYSFKSNDGVEVQSRPAIKLENNAIYIGEWNTAWERHGKGVQVWSDGSKYEGYWRNDRACGKGRLIHSDGDVYEGDWEDDMANGKGLYTHADSSYYEGDWSNDKQHGQGREVWPDGSSYTGSYVNGQKSGFGAFIWNDRSCFQGEFLFNSIHGFGKYTWADGREYVGNWQDNKMHGKGEFKWADGRAYYGDYVRDQKEGYGVFSWPDSKKYEGFWKRNKQHGKGVLIRGEKRLEGEWAEGKKVARGNFE